MKAIIVVSFFPAVFAVSARAELEPVGEAGPEVRVIICGVADSPKEVVLPAGAGVRGALFLTNNATSDYGWVPRTQIRRGGKIYPIKPGNQPDVRLQDGDFLEIPLRALYQEMAKPKKVMIEVDAPTQILDGMFNQTHLDIPGNWRTNWLNGIKGQELRFTDDYHYHSVFVCPCPAELTNEKPKERERELGAPHDSKNYILLTFHEIRAIDHEPKYEDREARIVSAVCRKLAGTPYLLNEGILTPFKEQKEEGSNKAREDKRGDRRP